MSWPDDPLSWTDKPGYEPAPPVNKNPWYDVVTSPLFPRPEPHDGTFVYLLEAGHAYKIRVSRDVPKRVTDLNCGSANEVELVAFRRGSIELEHRLHKRLKPYRLNGEWFRACHAVYEAFYMEPERNDDSAAVA